MITLDHRLRRLERRNAMLTVSVAGLALLVVAGVVWTAFFAPAPKAQPTPVAATSVQPVTDQARPTSPGAITAREVRIVDAQGATALRLDAGDGAGRLAVLTPDGDPILTLGAADGGGSLRIATMQGRAALEATALASGAGAMRTFSADGDGGVLLTATDTHAGAVSAFDRDGRPLAALGANAGGEGGVFIFNESGSTAAQMTTGADGRGVVEAANARGQAAAQLTTSDNGVGRVTVFDGAAPRAAIAGEGVLAFDPAGRAVISLRAGEHGGALEAFDARGALVAAVGAGAQGGALAAFDGQGRAAHIGADSLELRIDGAVVAAAMRTTQQGGALTINGRHGAPATQFLSGDLGGEISTFGPGGEMLASIVATTGGQGGFFAFNSDGKLALQLTASDEGAGVVRVNNDQGQSRLILSAGEAGRVDLIDARNRPTFVIDAATRRALAAHPD